MLPSLGTSDSWEKEILQDLLTEALFNSSSPGNQDSPKPLKEHSPLPHTEVYFEEQAPIGTNRLEVWRLLRRIFCLPTRPVWERLASFKEGDE